MHPTHTTITLLLFGGYYFFFDLTKPDSDSDSGDSNVAPDFLDNGGTSTPQIPLKWTPTMVRT